MALTAEPTPAATPEPAVTPEEGEPGSGTPTAAAPHADRGLASALRTPSAGRRRAGLFLLVLLGAASLVPPEAVWSPAPGRLAALLAGARGWLPVALAVATAGALVGAALARAGQLPAWGSRLARRPRAGLLVASGAGLAVGAVAGFAFGASPLHVDAVVQAFQANLLRGGAAVAPAPSLPEFFVTLNTAIRDGRWLGQFPPGFPALLALAPPGWGRVAVHALVAAWLAYAVYRAGDALFGRGEGLLAAALVAASPFALLLSASGLNHAAAAAAAATAFWLAVAGWGSRGRGAGAALACAGGFALGVLIATRPLDGLVVATLVAPLTIGRAEGRLDRGLCLAVGLAPALLLTGLYDKAVTGSALELGYTFVWGPAHGPGFHVSPWGEPHTLARGLFDLHRDLWLLDRDAFGRALPLLAAAALPLVLDSRSQEGGERRAGEAVLVALFLGLPAVYVLYWHHDWFLGPRYLFTVFPFFALLAARGTLLAARRLGGRPVARGAWVGALAAGALWLLAVDLPARTGAAFALRPEFRVDVAALARARGIDRGVIFVRESWGSRILARLLARGLMPSEAERLYRRADHCALERLLADPTADRARILAGSRAELERTPAPQSDGPRNGDPSLRLRPGALPAICGEEIAYDLAAPYGAFTPQLALEDPWLRGPLVVARDLRGENARLLAARGGGPGYLYIPGRLGAPGAFVPLGPGDVSAF